MIEPVVMAHAIEKKEMCFARAQNENQSFGELMKE
jgi:hypothetical protein